MVCGCVECLGDVSEGCGDVVRDILAEPDEMSLPHKRRRGRVTNLCQEVAER